MDFGCDSLGSDPGWNSAVPEIEHDLLDDLNFLENSEDDNYIPNGTPDDHLKRDAQNWSLSGPLENDEEARKSSTLLPFSFSSLLSDKDFDDQNSQLQLIDPVESINCPLPPVNVPMEAPICQFPTAKIGMESANCQLPSTKILIETPSCQLPSAQIPMKPAAQDPLLIPPSTPLCVSPGALTSPGSDLGSSSSHSSIPPPLPSLIVASSEPLAISQPLPCPIFPLSTGFASPEKSERVPLSVPILIDGEKSSVVVFVNDEVFKQIQSDQKLEPLAQDRNHMRVEIGES